MPTALKLLVRLGSLLGLVHKRGIALNFEDTHYHSARLGKANNTQFRRKRRPLPIRLLQLLLLVPLWVICVVLGLLNISVLITFILAAFGDPALLELALNSTLVVVVVVVPVVALVVGWS